MLQVYCHYDEDNRTRLATNAFSWDEAIQFIRILVSAHGYDFRDIKQHDEPALKCTMFDGYANNEYCYIVEDFDI